VTKYIDDELNRIHGSLLFGRVDICMGIRYFLHWIDRLPRLPVFAREEAAPLAKAAPRAHAAAWQFHYLMLEGRGLTTP
jgi:hypothetical protein